MENDERLRALIALLDDPDEEVYDHVRDRLFELGPTIIPELEDAWENSMEPVFQQRIEGLIHRIQFDGITRDFRSWLSSGGADLEQGLLIFNRVAFPDLDQDSVRDRIREIRKDIWIELNNYLTPLEVANVFGQILYNHHKFEKTVQHAQDARYTYLSVLLETHKGNPMSMAALYLVLAQQLDIPVYGVCLPHNFILAMTQEQLEDFSDPEMLRRDVIFYINPFNRGMIFTANEIQRYLRKVNIEAKPEFFLPADNPMVLREMLRYQEKLYQAAGATEKMEQVRDLLALFGGM